MLWFVDLEHDADASLLTRESLHLERGQDVQIVVLLGRGRLLVAHYDTAFDILNAAPFEIEAAQWTASDVDELLIVLGLLEQFTD